MPGVLGSHSKTKFSVTRENTVAIVQIAAVAGALKAVAVVNCVAWMLLSFSATSAAHLSLNLHFRLIAYSLCLCLKFGEFSEASPLNKMTRRTQIVAKTLSFLNEEELMTVSLFSDNFRGCFCFHIFFGPNYVYSTQSRATNTVRSHRTLWVCDFRILTHFQRHQLLSLCLSKYWHFVN